MSADEGVSYPAANFVAVRALAGALATTLGPTPRDKLVIEALASRGDPDDVRNPPTDEYVVTGDGARILDALDLDHPIAPVVRRIVGPERPGETAVEGADVPDGVTSTLVLAASLLDGAGELIERGLHPRTVQAGFQRGLGPALDALGEATRSLEEMDDPAAARRAVAATAMTGNDVGGLRDRWAAFAADAAALVGYPTPETFLVRTTRTGALTDSKLVRGTVLDRTERVSTAMPTRVDDARVLVLAGQDEGGLRSLEYGEKFVVDAADPDTLAAFEDVDAARRSAVVDRLAELGVGAVVAQQGIERPYATALADRGILGVDGVTPVDLRAVARATGARPVMKTDSFEADDLGRAGTVAERFVEPPVRGRPRRRIVVLEDCPEPASVCCFLRGVTEPLAEQAESGLRTATAAVALAEGRGPGPAGVIPGGGADALRVADALREAATATDAREALAVEAFADAAETLAGALAANAGADRLGVVADLRVAHAEGQRDAGFVHPAGGVADAVAAGVLDPFATRRRVYVAAVEVASRLLAIDDAIDVTHREEAPDPADANYLDAAEQQQSYLDRHDDTRWS